MLAPSRRAALLQWARARDAIVVEDDYDAEYRFDRDPVGALQGMAPDRVVYAGSASKTLAPALRLGWLVVPTALAPAIERLQARSGSAPRCWTSSRSLASSRAVSSTATCDAPVAATARVATH